VNNPYTQTVEMKDHGRGHPHVTSATAVWLKLGCQPPIRWVLIKDPKGSLTPSAPHRTTATPVQILQWFRSRAGRSHWKPVPIGVEFNVNGHHGRLPTPALLALFSIVTLVAHQQLLQHPFESSLVSEDTTDFADALAC